MGVHFSLYPEGAFRKNNETFVCKVKHMALRAIPQLAFDYFTCISAVAVLLIIPIPFSNAKSPTNITEMRMLPLNGQVN